MARVYTPEELDELISSNIKVVTADFEDEDKERRTLERIICPFYKGNPSCFGCSRKHEIITECRDEYVERIVTRKMVTWDESFDAVIVREQKKISVNNTMLCDTCYLGDNCPEKKSRSTCSIDWGEDISSMDYKKQLDYLIDIQQKRIAIARAAELQDGGMPDGILSSEMDRLSGLISQKNDSDTSRFSMNISAQGNGSAQAGGGILAKLFGQPTQPSLPEPTEEKMPLNAPEFEDAVVISEPKKKSPKNKVEKNLK